MCRFYLAVQIQSGHSAVHRSLVVAVTSTLEGQVSFSSLCLVTALVLCPLSHRGKKTVKLNVNQSTGRMQRLDEDHYLPL